MKNRISEKLINEWNYEKNEDIKPDDFSAGSNKKVWWMCNEGHEWYACIASRVKGSKCPYCSGKKAIKGKTDVFSVNPELECEWNYTRNNDINPKELTTFSNKIVWWKCMKGHEWKASINKRSYGSICPYCSGRELIPGETDLATLRPDLVAEWNYIRNGKLRPENAFPSSNKKVWWQCREGHEWQATINNRNNKTSGCPYCSGRTVIPGKTDVATLNPQLAYEWNYIKNGSLTPQNVSLCSNKRVWWKCKKGHEWYISPKDRNSGNNCPYCAGQKVIVGETDLASMNPVLVAEWNMEKNVDVTPFYYKAGSNKIVWWRCGKGHEWQASINSRNRGAGCPFCSGQKPIKGETDLASVKPGLTLEWNVEKNSNLHPNEVKAYSHKKVWWKCKEGHEWTATVYHRSSGIGCPYCASKKAILGKTDLLSVKPEFIEDWDYEKNIDLNPKELTMHSHKKVWWKCRKGHEWKASIDNRSKGTNCPYCSGHRMIKRT